MWHSFVEAVDAAVIQKFGEYEVMVDEKSLNFRFQSNSRSLIDIELPVSPKRTNGLVMPRFYLGFWQARASLLILSVKALAIICIYSTSYEFEVYWTAAVTNFWQASCNRKVCMKRCGALLALWGRVKSASSWCPQANDLPSWGDFQGCQSSCIWTWVSKVKQLESIKYEPKFKNTNSPSQSQVDLLASCLGNWAACLWNDVESFVHWEFNCFFPTEVSPCKVGSDQGESLCDISCQNLGRDVWM